VVELQAKDPDAAGNLSSVRVFTRVTRRRKRSQKLKHRFLIMNNWEERVEVRLDSELPSLQCHYLHGGRTRNRVWIITEKLDRLKGGKDRWTATRVIGGDLTLVHEVVIKPRIRFSPDLQGPWIQCEQVTILCRTARNAS
jgi:hypothetical protein